MEAQIAIAKIEQVLESHNERLKSIHGRLGEVQVYQGSQQVEIKVISKEVEEARSDIADSKRELGKAIRDMQANFDGQVDKMQKSFDERTEKIQENFDHKFETLTGAVRWGTGAIVGAIGILLTLLTQIH